MFYLSPLLIMAQQIFMSDELYISSSASLGEMVLGLAQFSSFIHSCCKTKCIFLC